jgi:integrase/recombinase XerC
MLYRTGVRCKELCDMMLEDLYPLDDGCALIRVRTPKGYDGGALPREVGLDRRAARHIFDWILQRGTSPGPLFVTRTGAKVLTQHVRRMLPKLGKRGGITRRVHAHAFRHTFAREMYDEGVGLMEIMLALGHTSLSTTQKYLRSIGATEVVNLTKRRDW